MPLPSSPVQPLLSSPLTPTPLLPFLQLADKEQECQELRQALEAAEGRAERLRAQHDRLVQLQSELQTSMLDQSQLIDNTKSETSRLSQQVAELQLQLQSSSLQRDEQQRALRQLADERDQLHDQLQQKNNQVEGLVAHVYDLRQSLEVAQHHSFSRVSPSASLSFSHDDQVGGWVGGWTGW